MNAQEQLDEDIGDTEELVRSVEKLNREVAKYRKVEVLRCARFVRSCGKRLPNNSASRNALARPFLIAPMRRYALGEGLNELGRR